MGGVVVEPEPDPEALGLEKVRERFDWECDSRLGRGEEEHAMVEFLPP